MFGIQTKTKLITIVKKMYIIRNGSKQKIYLDINPVIKFGTTSIESKVK